MKKIFILVLCITLNALHAQTGPGGVGTTDGLSNLNMWYDPSDTNTLTISAGKVIGLTNKAGFTVLDLAATTTAPVLNTAVQNGYNEMNFEAGADLLNSGQGLNTTNFVSNAVTAFAVSNPNTNHNHYLYSASNTSGGNRFLSHIPWSNGTVYFDLGDAYYSSGRISQGGLSNILNYNIWGTKADGTSKHLYQNSNEENVVNAGAGTFTSYANTTFRLGSNYQGQIAEVIIFKEKINEAKRKIIDNYLSAKYNITLSANDFYTQDDTANGDFDHNVAGIGQAADGSSHTDSQGTGVIRINTPSTLANNDYLFWGENVKDATYEFTTISTTTDRLNTTWRVSTTGNLGTVTVSFKEADVDLSNALKNCAVLKLSVDSNSNFTTARYYDLTLNAGVYTATNVTFNDAEYFTIESKIPETYWDGASWNNGVPSITKKATFSDDYDMTTQPSVTACLCDVAFGKNITIPNDKFLKVKHRIHNFGNVTVDHGGSIVQIDDTNNNIGVDYSIKKTANQTGAYDVTYFATPTATTSVNDMVPNTIYHYDFNASVQNWNYNLDPAANMTIGRGYILRNPVVGGDYTVNFTGEINNGIYTSPVLITGVGAQGDDDWNLLGNPYPSAIDADLFFATNNTVIKGAIYYWKHSTVLNGAGNDYVDGGYTVYNGAGGTATVNGTVGNITATQYIPSGVGFFVEATANGNITFSNAHRVTGNNSTVFRIADNANRIWLNIIENSTNKGRQQLIAFFDEATDGIDNLYDAHALNSGLSFYSLLNNEKYSIQSKDNNYEGEIIPLGYNCTQDDTYTITIDHTTGTIASNGNYIYLKDNELNIVHDLTDSDYTFSSVLGENNTRFELFATQQALDIREEVYTNNDSLFVIQNDNVFELGTATNATIKQVTIYDVVGRKLIRVNSNTVQLNVQKGQVLIFEILLENGSKLSKKVIKM